MIRITIELLSARTLVRSLIGYVEIANDGTGSRTKGNYWGKLYRRGSRERVWRRVEIKDFPRQRLTAYDLLYRVLRETVGDRNRLKGV